MGYWHFKSYEGEDGNQPWAWLGRQEEAVRDYVYAQLYGVSNIEDAPTEEFADLPKRYAGLSQLSIGFDAPFGIRHVGMIGFWEPDSTNFIVVVCCEVDARNYGVWLERASKYRRDWQEGRGEVYALFPDQDFI